MRVVDVLECQAAGFARRFDRNVADTEHPLNNRLLDTDVLNLRELDDAAGFRSDSRLVTQTVAGQHSLGVAKPDPAYGRPEQKREQQQRKHAEIARIAHPTEIGGDRAYRDRE